MKIEQHDISDFADVPPKADWRPQTKRQSAAAAVLLLACFVGTGVLAVAIDIASKGAQ